MIWYETPVVTGMTMFVVLLLTTALQMLIALHARELLRDKRALRFIRLLYSLLAVISAVLSLEALLAIASIEGGIFLAIPALPRYVSVLPALLFLFTIQSPVELPPGLRPPVITFFVPLLRLPPMDWLPESLPVALAVFAAAWLALDAARMLLSFRAYARTEVTRSVMAHIIRGISHGICVTNRRGWILESNPAFISLCESLGIHKAERIDEFYAALRALCDDGRVKISELENGKSIQTGSGVFFLQRSGFKAGWKTFEQLALSDVTEITRAAAELERENENLAQKNRDLEKAIFDIELEETVRERERLCRAAHDLWSQRLAVAGLSIDILLDRKEARINSGDLEEIARTLEVPVMAEPAQTICDLPEVLGGLTCMYRKLGVEIRISGQADFTGREQEALCAVFREALANAVRHAYARQIDLHFYENSEIAGVTIQNECLDDQPGVAEGRGLHDIKTRIRNAGGSVQYEKSDLFLLKVLFPKEPTNQEEVTAL